MPTAPYSSHPANPIKNWQELVDVEATFDGADEWAFRGQDTLAFPASSLERHCKTMGIEGSDIADLEVKLIRDFARRYHLYKGYAPPAKGHTLEWLSLLQHYGAPTRLVDFTYSFFMATHFALERAQACAVIWAVNATVLHRVAKAHIVAAVANGRDLWAERTAKRDDKPFRALFMHPSRLRFVDVANPLRLNERLTIQQGLFLAPGNVTVKFEDNIRAMPGHTRYVRQIILDAACRRQILCKLHRMGINSATLFPGLDGFAKSLHTKSLILRNLPAQDVELLEEV